MANGVGNDYELNAVGLMSGTSLDGLDLALCRFFRTDGIWAFNVIRSDFKAYDEARRNRLVATYTMPINELESLHVEYGKWIGQCVMEFLGDDSAHLIASHGHTTHHDPNNGITNQLGCGQTIANLTGIKTIFDFRSEDVSLGGQGAPLVPIGDQLLFGNYEACINLGGFSNISFETDNQRIAFDICPVNTVMNQIAEEHGKPFDDNGDLARAGTIDGELLSSLEKVMSGFRVSRPSLSREWVEQNIEPCIASSIKPQDCLRTIAEFAADEMAYVLNGQQLKNVLLTGGGTYNSFLIEVLKTKTDCEIIIPEKTIIDFKEAIVFAFLGVLREFEETNVLKNVTGASKNSSSGRIAFPS